jgi:NAD(P)-dependent dehydrogenase (short-subunit alcohol dehydrogenase family)
VTQSNDVALITGAGSGIGRAVALQLATERVDLVLNDIDETAARATGDAVVELGATSVSAGGDVSDRDVMSDLVSLAERTFGRLTMAVNNAGVTGPTGPIADIDPAQFLRLLEVNVHSVFYGLQFEIPALRRAGGGSIVNVSSILGLVGQPFATGYVTAKHAVAGLTKAAALEVAGEGIRINSVHPGYVDTPLLADVPPEIREYLREKHPLGRLGTAEEVAEVVCFLLSIRSRFVTGSTYVVDGGYTAQ